MSDKNLPRSSDPGAAYAITGSIWDKLCAMVEGGQIETGPGLSLTPVPGGSLLRLVTGELVRQLKITGTETGGGIYKGRTIIGTPTNIAVGSNLSLPLAGMALANADDALILFPLEAGAAEHNLPIPSFGAGLLLGISNDSTPRKIFIWLSGFPVGTFYCAAAEDGSGADGSKTTAATWKYTVTLPSGATKTSVDTIRPRPNGKMVKATAGWGAFTTSGTFVFDAFEKPTTVGC